MCKKVKISFDKTIFMYKFFYRNSKGQGTVLLTVIKLTFKIQQNKYIKASLTQKNYPPCLFTTKNNTISSICRKGLNIKQKKNFKPFVVLS